MLNKFKVWANTWSKSQLIFLYIVVGLLVADIFFITYQWQSALDQIEIAVTFN